MPAMPIHKYRAYESIDLPDRTWPAATITKPPIWFKPASSIKIPFAFAAACDPVADGGGGLDLEQAAVRDRADRVRALGSGKDQAGRLAAGGLPRNPTVGAVQPR